jgi:hypothetical protein
LQGKTGRYAAADVDGVLISRLDAAAQVPARQERKALLPFDVHLARLEIGVDFEPFGRDFGYGNA